MIQAMLFVIYYFIFRANIDDPSQFRLCCLLYLCYCASEIQSGDL